MNISIWLLKSFVSFFSRKFIAAHSFFTLSTFFSHIIQQKNRDCRFLNQIIIYYHAIGYQKYFFVHFFINLSPVSSSSLYSIYWFQFHCSEFRSDCLFLSLCSFPIYNIFKLYNKKLISLIKKNWFLLEQIIWK